MKCTICGNEYFMDFGHTELCLCCGKQNKKGDGELNLHLANAYLELHQGNFTKADQILDRVVAEEPGNAYAYLGLLMAKLHIKNTKELSQYTRSFQEESYFKRAYGAADNAGDAALKTRLMGYVDSARESAVKIRYERSIELMKSAKTSEEWNHAAHWMETAMKYAEGADEYAKLLEECRRQELLYIQAEAIYPQAVQWMEQETPDWQKAFDLLEQLRQDIPDYKDVAVRYEKCKENVPSGWKAKLMDAQSKAEQLAKQSVALLKEKIPKREMAEVKTESAEPQPMAVNPAMRMMDSAITSTSHNQDKNTLVNNLANTFRFKKKK